MVTKSWPVVAWPRIKRHHVQIGMLLQFRTWGLNRVHAVGACSGIEPSDMLGACLCGVPVLASIASIARGRRGLIEALDPIGAILGKLFALRRWPVWSTDPSTVYTSSILVRGLQ